MKDDFFSNLSKNLGSRNIISCLSIPFHNTVVGWGLLTYYQKDQRYSNKAVLRELSNDIPNIVLATTGAALSAVFGTNI